MGALDTAIDGALDPLDGAIDGVVGDKRKANVYNAVQQNPDEFAQAAQLSRSTGLPAPVVARNLPQVKQRADLDALDGVIEQSPAVRKAMDDPTFAILARDDAETLAEIERTAGRRAGGRIGGPAYQRPDEMKASQGPEASFASVVSGMFSALPQGAEQTRQGMRMQFADVIGSPEMSIDAMRRYQRAQTETALSTPQFDSLTAAGLYSGGVSLVQQAPGLVASILMRTPLPGLANIGAQTEATAYGKYRSRGATPGEALAGGAGEGAVEVATELLPMSFLVNRFGKAGAGEFLAGLLAREIPSEQIATLVQDAIDTAVANPGKTWQQYLEERPGAAYQTLVATVAQAGAMGAISTVAQRVAAPTMQAEAAGAEAETLAQLSQLAAASKLRERDPQTFEQYVEAAAPGQEVYLDARTLQQSGVDLAALAQASPAVASQITEALATGGDITIPVSEYAARLAGTDLDTALLPHLRASEDALSQDEAQRFYQGQAEEFKNAAAKVMEDKATDDAWQASAKAVETQLLEQLQQTGRFTPDVNNAYATLMRDFYVATAARLGVTPEEMAARYPIRIAAQSADGGQVLSQEVDTPAGAAKPPLQRFFQSVTNLLKGGDPSGKEGQGRRQEVLTDGGTAPLDMGQFFQGTKVDQTFYSQLARAELMEGAPTPNSGELGSRALSKQDAGAASVRAVTGALKEPAQSGGGAGSKANATDIPASVQEAALKAARKEQDRLNEYDLQEEIRSIGNNGMLDISKLASIPEYWDAENEEFTQAGLKEIDRLTEEKARDNLNIRPINELEDLNDAHQFVQVEVMEKILDGLGIDYERNYSWSTSRYIMVDRGGDSEPLKLRFADHLNTARGQPSPDINVAPGGDTFMDAVAAVFFQPAGQTGNRAEIRFGEDITQQPSVIALFNNADLSSFLHEMGHFQLEVLAHIASQPNAPAEIVQDMERVLKWFGVPDLATWQAMSHEEKRPYREQLARGFEAYLFEGKAPSQELTSVFQRFRAWLISVYKSIKVLNVEISDDIRGVFDRLVATDDAIKAAEAARAYTPLFPDDPEAQALAAKATQDATDELQRRSLRDMRWLDNARGRILKQMQADAKAKRQAVEAEVREEVKRMPAYAAMHFLKRGELFSITTEESIKAEVHRLDTAALAEMYPEGMLVRPALERLQGMTRKEGLHPDLVAEMISAAGYPFTSGDHLVREIIAAEPEAQLIEGMTDQRMLERYGDLTDPDTLARAVDEAIHNEMRLKVLATELKAATQAPGPVRAIMQAAKQYAEKALAGKKIKGIKPRQHAAAETRAGKAAMQAFGKGDMAALAVEKRNQVLQGYLTKMSYEALDEIDKARDFFRRVISGKDDQVVKTRDLDVVNAARAILANYGFGQKAKTAAEYLKAVRAYDPAMYDVLKDRVDVASTNGKPFEELTLEEMRGLRDEIEALWYLAKRSRQMEVDGDLLDRQDVQAALRERIEEIGVPDKVPGEGSAITPAEERLRKLQTARAAARRVEAWVEAKDGGSAVGPFRKYLWQVVKDAADRYRTDKATYLKALRDALAEVPNLKRGLIDAPELGYTFGKDEGGVGMSEIMHALLHVGNESNRRKLLLGRNWATENADGTLNTARWDAFIDRMHREGTITKAHYDARQKIWDTLEALKPLAQKTHRDVFGKYFAEIPAEQQVTPFGTYRGGYVPAMADTRIVNDADLRKLAEAENESLTYAFPTTSKGFTKSRVEYNRPLLLDLRTLAQHVDKVLLFSHLEQPVRDVRRVLMAKDVSYGLTRIDPAAYDGLLIPWLNRTAKQQVETPIPGDRGLMRFFSVMRQRAGMAAMFANVSNTLQQITGFSLAVVKVKPKYLLGAMADYVKAPKATAQTVAEASPYMATRMENEVAQMMDNINDILLDPSTYEKAQAWTAKHAYFMQSAVDNVMSPVVWLGAYNQALEQGTSENDARRIADGTVRQTQGSTLPEDISRFETGNAFVRMFSQFASYFNMQANLLGTAYAQTIEQMGVRKGAGRMLYITMFGFLAPAWVAEAIAQAFRGGPDDEDDDGYLDDWLMAVFGLGALRNATAMIPVAGQGINAFVNAANSKPYDDRLGTSPAVSMIESAVRAPASVYKAVVDDASKQKAVRDVATLITLTTGLPTSAVARPVGYGVGVAAGEIRPENEADFARGLISGAKGQHR